MDITPAIPDGKKLIESYGVGRFRISGVLYEHAVMVTGDDVLPLTATSLTDITPDMLIAPLQNASVELLLLGTGATQIFASKDLKAALRAHGITVESMASDAACRTYNVLLAEGRLVAAALLPQ